MKKIWFAIFLMLSHIVALGQWNDNPAEAVLINTDGEYFFSYDLAMTPNGNTWLWLNAAGDAHKVQLYDTTGVAMLGDTLMLVSDYPDRLTGYVNQNLFVDRDGNAIVVVSDLRYTNGEGELGTYTAYKISQSGEMLWGDEGISLDNGNGTFINAMMGIVQLSDGSYVFSWTHCDMDEIFSVDLQRVSADGLLLWDAAVTRLTDPKGKESYFWPYIVDAGNSQCIVVFTRGSNLDLYARKLDFDGSPVWSEDTRIYRSGFPSTPLWTFLDVEPSGDGGAIVTWYDDRFYTNTESIYMSYIKPNGELGFATGIDGQKLSYSGYRALSTDCMYDPATDSFIALWRESSQGQGFYRVVAQRVSKEGELLWGEEGLEIEPYQEKDCADVRLCTAADGQVAAFYMRRETLEYGDVDICMQLIDTHTGTTKWESSKVITDEVETTYKADLHITECAPQNFWVYGWDDRGKTSNMDYKMLYINRVNSDGSVGNPADAAVAEIEAEGMSFAALPSVVDDEAMFAVDMPIPTQVTLAIYNVNGDLIANPFNGELSGRTYIEWKANVPSGVYFAVLSTAQDVRTIKLIIK